jgi:GABA permease
MWLFPGLSILTVVGIFAVLAQMALDPEIRPQLVLSLVAWAVVLVLYGLTKVRGGSVDPVAADVDAKSPTPPSVREDETT